MLLHLPPMPGRDGPRTNNGPPLTGSGAEAVRDAISAQLGGLPAHLRRSLTWDQGAELAQHGRLKIETGLEVYFCDPQSPWQRGTNENTNGLLRQYFPKGTDLVRHSADDLAAVADALNSRPRKTLGWRTPAEVLDEHLAAAADSPTTTTTPPARDARARGYRRYGPPYGRASATTATRPSQERPSTATLHYRQPGVATTP